MNNTREGTFIAEVVIDIYHPNSNEFNINPVETLQAMFSANSNNEEEDDSDNDDVEDYKDIDMTDQKEEHNVFITFTDHCALASSPDNTNNVAAVTADISNSPLSSHTCPITHDVIPADHIVCVTINSKSNYYNVAALSRYLDGCVRENRPTRDPLTNVIIPRSQLKILFDKSRELKEKRHNHLDCLEEELVSICYDLHAHKITQLESKIKQFDPTETEFKHMYQYVHDNKNIYALMCLDRFNMLAKPLWFYFASCAIKNSSKSRVLQYYIHECPHTDIEILYQLFCQYDKHYLVEHYMEDILAHHLFNRCMNIVIHCNSLKTFTVLWNHWNSLNPSSSSSPLNVQSVPRTWIKNAFTCDVTGEIVSTFLNHTKLTKQQVHIYVLLCRSWSVFIHLLRKYDHYLEDMWPKISTYHFKNDRYNIAKHAIQQLDEKQSHNVWHSIDKYHDEFSVEQIDLFYQLAIQMKNLMADAGPDCIELSERIAGGYTWIVTLCRQLSINMISDAYTEFITKCFKFCVFRGFTHLYGLLLKCMSREQKLYLWNFYTLTTPTVSVISFFKESGIIQACGGMHNLLTSDFLSQVSCPRVKNYLMAFQHLQDNPLQILSL